MCRRSQNVSCAIVIPRRRSQRATCPAASTDSTVPSGSTDSDVWTHTSMAYMRLFREIVLDVWKNKQADGRRQREAAERRVHELRQRLDRIDEAFIHERARLTATPTSGSGTRSGKTLPWRRWRAHDLRLDELVDCTH